MTSSFNLLKAKLRELFELDKADLDFGIYRVLRQRHREITEFLDKHLEKTVRTALQSHETLQRGHVEQELEQAEKAAAGAGIAPEQSPKVMELRAKLKGDFDLEATADEVYSHLLTFFSRYYQGGDFLGLHRSTVHGREKYMIPYNGEEVKLIWANMDQYYIKSSELLRDYTFRISREDAKAQSGELGLDDLPENAVVRFKLVEGDTEKDNRKPDGKTTRAFALDEEKPFEVSREDAKPRSGEPENTLTIRFRYREHASERNLQQKINEDTLKFLADNLPTEWRFLLRAFAPSREKKEPVSLLQKHLRNYTARHTFDYFIHKDLGGFLRRELDFYIKNEVMHLDDIEETTAPKAEEYLSKIRAIRRCAMPVIQMLAQLEDFQKKLWLKKKFVVETRYCITLDRVPESIYPEICACDAQWQEWEELVTLSELNPQRTPEFLKANPYLMLDTRHFSQEFTLKLLSSIEDLDGTLDGVCFHSENFQALQLTQECYREQVKCVYTDPPYNTSETSLLYKNEFRHSSWIAMLFQVLKSCRPLFNDESVMAIAIDDFENHHLSKCLDSVFTPAGRLGTLVVEIKPSGRTNDRFFATSHEFYHLFGLPSCTAEIGFFPLSEETKQQYDEADDEGAHKWRDFLRTGGFSTPEERPNSYYPIYYNPESDEARLEQFPGALEILPIDSEGKKRVWRKTPPSFLEHYEKREIKFDKRSSGTWKVQLIDRIKDGVRPKSVWVGSKYDAASHGTKLLKKLFGECEFGFPKSLWATQDVVFCAMGDLKGGTIADIFAGSGTTGHAVINLNRQDHGNRKYLLAEMGEYFDTVLVPRLKKVVYSTDWKEGKPQSRDTGISHAFKIVRLESYEDTLNNLHLRRTPEQDAALAAAGESNRDQYLLGYFLDVESAGSASLLDVAQFRDPFAYKLQIATSSAGETKETRVDLVETFNWLLGLKVKHIETYSYDPAKRTFTSTFIPQPSSFLLVSGEKRAGGRCLILWRTLSDDPKADNAALEKFLTKLAVNPADTEYDFIYVNGAHTLNDPHNKVHLIEETFQRLMFDTTNFESLS